MKKMGTKLLLLFFLLAIALPASAQSTKEALKVAQKRKDINYQLEMLAKDMAKELGRPSFRGFLQSEISQSQFREQILESKTFLAKAAGLKEAAPGLQKLRDSAMKTSKVIMKSGIWDLEGLDIYFPVEDHRKKWKGDEDLLVAFSPVDDEQDIVEIIAYSVKSGERVVLDAEKPPETPVLVIAPEEHETLETKPPPPPTDKGAVKGPKPAGSVESETGPSNSYFGVRYLRIDDDQEPWTKGAPEIYAYYIQRAGPTYCQVTYKDLYWVDKERSWYNVWYYLARYFNTTQYSDLSYIRIYERDGGTYRTYSVTIDGQTCLYGKRDGDDYIATQWRRKSAYGFDYDYYQDWGRAAVKLRKTH